MKIPNHRLCGGLLIKYTGAFLCILFLLLVAACNRMDKESIIEEKPVKAQNKEELTVTPTITPTVAPASTSVSEKAEATASDKIFTWIDEKGTTLEKRIHTPKGYTRIDAEAQSITEFLREFPLKKAGSDVLLYTGEPKTNQASHIAIFDMDIGDRDLEQCADSIIRILAEYYWSIAEYDKIAFHLTNGFLMEYTKWRDGNRLVVKGNKVSWAKTNEYDDSYKEFKDYLMMVFAYAGTLSLSDECSSIDAKEILPGDMFLEGGSPGHCVMVVDVAEDENGNRCFLLAQGYMPAQDFHIIKNPLHEENPWYYTSELTYPFETPLWTFEDNSLVRWKGLR